MRIAHVIPTIDPRAGGPTTALLGLAGAQVKAGLDVRVLCTFRDGDDRQLPESFRERGVEAVMVGPVRGKLGRHPQLASAVEDFVAAADVVHIQAVWEQILHLAARAAQARGKPYVITPHGMLDPWSLRQNRWAKRIMLACRVRRNFDRASALHFTSDVEQQLAEPLGIRARSIVEPNGIDLCEFDHLPPPGTFARHMSNVGSRRFLLFLGRVHPKKGLDLLIPAFARIADDPALAGVMLVIAGPGAEDYALRVRQSAAEHQVADRVIMTGMLTGETRLAALSEAELFILPSYQENFGIAVAESLAAGTPVIISDQVNIHAEIKAAGVGGVVATQIEPLAAEILAWMRDAPRRQNAARQGPIFVRERYDWLEVARRWREHYLQLDHSATST